MTKLKTPLLSLGAVGRLAKTITIRRRGKLHIAETIPIPKDTKSPPQLIWRHMYQKAIALWHALSTTEKQEWESLARPKHMTGFAYFISLALKPNPGLYLPLQGGTMSGDIDMDTSRILDLPNPVLDQEPVTKKYFQDNPPAAITFNTTQVFTGTSSITFTDLDLSPVIGAVQSLVILKIANLSDYTLDFGFRRNGDSANFFTGGFWHIALIEIFYGKYGYLCVPTDTNGIIEWRSGAAKPNITIWMEAYLQ